MRRKLAPDMVGRQVTPDALKYLHPGATEVLQGKGRPEIDEGKERFSRPAFFLSPCRGASVAGDPVRVHPDPAQRSRDREKILSEVLRDGEEIVMTWKNSLFGLKVTEVFQAQRGMLVLTSVTFADPQGLGTADGAPLRRRRSLSNGRSVYGQRDSASLSGRSCTASGKSESPG